MNMLQIRNYEPGELLKPYVLKYYQLNEHHGKVAPFFVAPSGNIYINFNFLTKWKGYNSQEYFPGSKITINGQIDKEIVLCYADGLTDSLGIELKPCAACKLLNVPMELITNKMIPFNEVYNKGIDELYDKLISTSEIESRILILENWLKELLKQASEIPAYVEKSINIIEKEHGNVAIKDIAHHTGYSKRTLEKQFQRYIGLSTKQYAQVKRINFAIKLGQHMPSINWHTIVHKAGFYDQSHFIKVFQSIMNCSPTEYFDIKESILDEFIGR